MNIITGKFDKPGIGIVTLLFLCLFLSPDIYALPEFIPNSELASVNIYNYDFGSGAGNLNIPANGSREFCVLGNKWRIRQDGDIDKLKFYTGDISNVSSIKVKIWRRSENGLFDLVAATDNLLSKTTPDTLNEIFLDEPLTGVLEGDFYSLRLESSGTNHYPVRGIGNAHATTYYHSGGTAADSPAPQNFDWVTQSSQWTEYSAVPVEFFMVSPQISFIGDSLVSGVPGNYSYIQQADYTSTDNSGSMEYQLSEMSGYTYQNMGFGSQTTIEISARFESDAVNRHPRMVVINGGINNMSLSLTEDEYLSNWNNMLSLCEENNIVAMVLLMLPCNTALCNQNAFMENRDAWKSSLAELAGSYNNTITVDADVYAGQYREGGADGNLWDIRPEYDSGDHIHLNPAGYGRVSQALFDALRPRAEITPIASGWNNDDIHLQYNLYYAEPAPRLTIAKQDGYSGFQYSLDGSLWSYASVNVEQSDNISGLVGALGDGMQYTVVWDSRADVPDLEDESVFLRLKPSDDETDALDWRQTEAFGIDNKAPTIGANLFFRAESPGTIIICRPVSISDSGSGVYGWYAQKSTGTLLGPQTMAARCIRDKMLLANTKYTYRLIVEDMLQNQAVYPHEASAFTAAPRPAGLSAIKPPFTNDKVVLSVKPFPNDDQAASAYFFFRLDDDGKHESGWIKENTWMDTGFKKNQWYMWGVKYRNGDSVETKSIYVSMPGYPNTDKLFSSIGTYLHYIGLLSFDKLLEADNIFIHKQ